MSAWAGSKDNPNSERHHKAQEQASIVTAALGIAASGFPVFPCDADKQPLVKDWGKVATRDPAAIKRLFSKPAAKLIGVPTGKLTGIDGLDLDPKNGSSPWRERNLDRLTETLIHGTMNSGEHWIYAHIEGVRNQQDGKTIHPGVDVRGEGGYLIWPPSPGYSVIHDAPIAPWPDWLLPFVVKQDKPPPPRPETGPTIRTDQLDRRYQAYIDGLLANVRSAAEGTKHDTLLKNSRALGGVRVAAGISREEALALLLQALPDTVRDWDNARKTALAGLIDGEAHPIELEDRPYHRANGKAHDEQQGNGTTHKAQPNNDQECSLATLQHEQFEPIKWIVPDYIPEGLTVFAGRPKIGKSWLMLGVALGVARGTEALGQFVEQGDVLYCGLEDGKRRMQRRVDKMLGRAIKHWPGNFTFRYRLDPLDAGGLDTIEAWLIEHPNRRLVVIDTLGRVRGMKQPREEPYQYDYRLMAALQVLAIHYNVAIVVVHHVRKSDAEDVLDTISGTTGIAGAADTCIVLGKTQHGVRFYLRGRDAEEQDKLLEFDPDTAIWSVTGDYDEAVPSSPTHGVRKLIFDLLAGSPVALTPQQIAERLGQDRGTVRMVLTRMSRSTPPQVAKELIGMTAAYTAQR